MTTSKVCQPCAHRSLIVQAPLVDVKPLDQRDLQPTYAYRAADADTHNHGACAFARWKINLRQADGSFMNGLGSCIGTLGAIPCCPFPNPYKARTSTTTSINY